MSSHRPTGVLTAAALAAMVGGRVRCGDPARGIRAIATLDDAGADDLAFIADALHAAGYPATAAGVVLVSAGIALPPFRAAADGRAEPTIVEVADAGRALVPVLQALAPEVDRPPPGVHPDASVSSAAILDGEVRIGPRAIVGPRARLGAGAVIHGGAVVYPDVRIGAGTEIHAGAVLRERVTVGAGCIIHAGAVIGSEGFGYIPAADGRSLIRVPHIGTVRIEDDVEIGANTCVDRAKFGATTIGAGTRIDNLCQVAHNCRIGRMCVIAAGCAIGGSTRIGDGVQVGGGTAMVDHAVVGDRARIGGQTGVIGTVPAGAQWLGLPGRPAGETLRVWAAVRKLPAFLASRRRQPEPGAADGGAGPAPGPVG